MFTLFDYTENKFAIEFCTNFSKAQISQRFVLGTNDYGKVIADNYEIKAFIDDFSTGTSFYGKPILRRDQVPNNALVVSSLLGRPKSGEKALDEIGVKHLDFFSFYRYSKINGATVKFWCDYRQEIINNKEKYASIYNRLTDEDSKETFSNITNFRFSSDLKYMSSYEDRELEQYFEEFLELESDNEIFVDIGGFDAYTTLEFIKRCSNYEKIYYFEPDPINMAASRNNLMEQSNIEFHECGLSDSTGKVGLNLGGSTSSISDSATTEISVDKLDNIISDRVTFIKMDTEGAEEKVIEGARNTIKKYHPRLAISVYHKVDDLWRLPEQILSIRDDYKLFLRHYTEGVSESVMFFIPSTNI